MLFITIWEITGRKGPKTNMKTIEAITTQPTYEQESNHERSEAAAWMASSREAVGDILLKNAALDGAIPTDVAAMAAASYRSALSWRDQGSMLAPSSDLEPLPQLNWTHLPHPPSPQLISGVSAASEYLTLTAPPAIQPFLETAPIDEGFVSLAEGLEGLIAMIFGAFMPWFSSTPPSR